MKDNAHNHRLHAMSALTPAAREAVSSLTLAILLLFTGCGLRFAPGYSIYDKNYFSEIPQIVVHSEGPSYGLRWKYGEMGFFFRPEAKIVSGELCFSLQGTSSSGSLRGLYDEAPIKDPEMIQALRNGGAFWLEPNGQKVRLAERKL